MGLKFVREGVFVGYPTWFSENSSDLVFKSWFFSYNRPPIVEIGNETDPLKVSKLFVHDIIPG